MINLNKVDDQAIKNEALEQLLSSFPEENLPVMISLLVVGLVMVYLIQSSITLKLSLLWFVLLLLILMYCRWAQVDVCSSNRSRDDKLLHIRFSSLLLAMCLSLVVISYPHLPVENRTIICCILLSIAASSINHLRGIPCLFYIYSYTLVLPQTLVFIALPMRKLEDRVLIPILCVIVMYIYYHLARTIWKYNCDNVFVHRQEKFFRQRIAASLNEVKNANFAKSSFLAAASHDLRQPLQSIDLLVNVLQMRFSAKNSINIDNDISNGKIINNLGQVVKELTYILDDLLDYSRIEVGELQPRLEEFNLSHYLEEQFNNFSQLINAHNLKIIIEVIPDIFVVSDRQIISRILRNLVHNAIKFTSQGYIKLSLEKKGEKIAIIITDTGCGISEQHQKLIFQEYTQLNNPANLKNKGYGLGLAIVKGLAEILKIQIELQSNIGRGSSFTLLLAAENNNSINNNEFSSYERLSLLSLLLIEDNHNNRLSAKLFLQELGCVCWEAKDADEALVICQRIQPDAIISDYRLGNIDGLSLIKKIQQIYPHLPAILVSGEDNFHHISMLNKNITFLKKPIEIDRLIELLIKIENEKQLAKILQN